MQLRQPETLACSISITRRVRDVDPHFDHAGRDEDVDLVVAKVAHRRVALSNFMRPCTRPTRNSRTVLASFVAIVVAA